jgi:hypothetical protein
MKVFIGPYKSWLNVYNIVDHLQKIGVSEKMCEDIADWIIDNTNIQNYLDNINERKNRKIKIRIDKYDTWNMDCTLAYIIIPMLKQLKETKNGSQIVDEEDLPVHMRHTFRKHEEDYDTDDRWIHYKWDWVLDEMIWAFEQKIDDNAKDKFYHGTAEYEWELVSGVEGEESAMHKMHQTNADYWVDTKGMEEYQKRIDNGLRLFGKYYNGLWD